MAMEQQTRERVLREFYGIALTRGHTPQKCRDPAVHSSIAGSSDQAAEIQDSLSEAASPSTVDSEANSGPQQDPTSSTGDQAPDTSSASPTREETLSVDSPRPSTAPGVGNRCGNPSLPEDPSTTGTQGAAASINPAAQEGPGDSIGSSEQRNEANVLQQDDGYTALGDEDNDADTPCAELSAPAHDQKGKASSLPQHSPPPLGDSRYPNGIHDPTTTTEGDVNTEPRKPQHIGDLIREELSTLRELQSAWKDTACQHCRLFGLGCDRARPSCWNCQQSFLQCCYGFEIQEQNYQSSEVPPEQELESRTWMGARRDCTYYSLEGEKKKSRVETRFLKAQPTRPKPSQKATTNLDDASNKEEREALLRAFSLVEDEGSLTLVETEVHTASPDITPPSSPCRRNSHTKPSPGDERTIPLVFAESVPSTPSLRSRSGVETTPPTSGGSGSQAPLGEGRSNDSPKLFQCTFCLKRCEDQEEWTKHENTQHTPQQEWICMPWGPIESPEGRDICVFCGTADVDTEHCSIHKHQPCYSQETRHRTYASKREFQSHLLITHNQPTMSRIMEDWWWVPEDNAWYWNCGFCGDMLARWSDRAEHIGDHFQKGETMSSWDPLITPSPIDKYTLDRIAGFPPPGWDAGTLLALQPKRPGRTRREQAVDEEYRCELCGVCCRDDADAERHTRIWHSNRDIWLCPTLGDIQSGSLAASFFPINQAAENPDEAACPLCSVLFIDLAQLYPDLDDWEARTKHLEVDHDVGKCQAALRFMRSGDILLHLANKHSVSLSDYTGSVIDSCKKVVRPLAETISKEAGHNATKPDSEPVATQ